ncbi:HoxN/HupN/NixA family nickel/cobalt transporter [Microbacterium mangrovi]|uniref:HoxN/HupN/NixA family nickel/cobalt transporter n=1 Tax=Microbacterium mangrovi TaxID=1348253 RepID=UPI000AC113C2|nr:HoxN/HupN/NixA family nickel/cobalt transporter [Microbacterium mangrovi]
MGWPVARMAAAIVVLHVAGVLLLFSAPDADGHPIALGLGLTAYTLGLRHAFDADHIAAIDNTTRKLVGDGRSPVSVGFWFSLGHSSVVFGLTVALALGARALIAPIEDDSSTLHHVTGLIGTGVSGLFLYAIAAINLVLLVAGLRTFRAVRAGRVTAQQADQAALGGGPLVRLFGRAVRSIRRPWQMYPLGVLFGFGFDTATEIALLVVAASSAAAGMPWYAMLALPILFAAGMSLLDTADGLVMRFAYGWAFDKPGRRMRYNLSVTALSVAVALIVGTLEFASLLGDRFHLDGGFWDWVGSIDLGTAGIGIVALLIAVWVAALATASLRRRRRPNDMSTEAPVVSAEAPARVGAPTP